jgi:ABC-type dipeptide/oligopeptide/nickel transport system permease component
MKIVAAIACVLLGTISALAGNKTATDIYTAAIFIISAMPEDRE